MAAYGLYTHIASNKFRSMLLLGGLFLLIYVLVFAGALLVRFSLARIGPSATSRTLSGPGRYFLRLARSVSSRRWAIMGRA